MMNPSPEWRDEARRNRREANLRANEAPVLLEAPTMPQQRRGPIFCCGISVERNSREAKMIQRFYCTFLVVGFLWMLAEHDSSQDGMSLLAYTVMLALTMCFTPLLILSPFVVAGVCKCWYERKIEAAVAETLLAQAEAAQARDGGQATVGEEARRERMRSEMAASVMSGLRDGGAKPDVDPGGFDGNRIVEGELLGDIVTVYLDGGDGFRRNSAGQQSPMSAGVSLVRSPVSGVVEFSGWSDPEVQAHEVGRLGASEMGPALGLVATGRVVAPGDWRLHVDAGRL